MTEKRVLLAIVLLISAALGAQAQACLHGDDETPEQQQRTSDAVLAMRTLNTAEYMHRQETGQMAAFPELVTSAAWVQMNRDGKLSSVPGTELLPGFDLHLVADEESYSIALKDNTDPCSFTLFTNDAGIIYTGFPTR